MIRKYAYGKVGILVVMASSSYYAYDMDQTPQVQDVPQPTLPVSPQPPATSKKGLLIGGIIAAVLVLLGGLGWWLVVSAQEAYPKNAVTYEDNLEEAFLFYKNATDTSKQKDQIRDKFDAALASRPQEPNVLGIPLSAPPATKERLDAISEPFTAMRDSFVEFHTFNTFADKTLTILDDMERVVPLADIHENEAVFNKAADDIRALECPDGETIFKEEKAKVLSDIAIQVGKAETAYAAIDTAAYNAAQAEIKALQQKITVDGTFTELQKIYRGYYDDLSAKYDAAAEALGIEG